MSSRCGLLGYLAWCSENENASLQFHKIAKMRQYFILEICLSFVQTLACCPGCRTPHFKNSNKEAKKFHNLKFVNTLAIFLFVANNFMENHGVFEQLHIIFKIP
jgi:hypothetical protein